jgi:hypothetical protein
MLKMVKIDYQKAYVLCGNELFTLVLSKALSNNIWQ